MSHNIFVLVLFVAFITYFNHANGQADCHICELIMNDVKAYFFGHWNTITNEQLTVQLEFGCLKYHEFGDSILFQNCLGLVDAASFDDGSLLEMLKADADSFFICRMRFLCGI